MPIPNTEEQDQDTASGEAPAPAVDTPAQAPTTVADNTPPAQAPDQVSAPAGQPSDPNNLLHGYNADQHTAQDLAFMNDVTQGKIHPKTYSDLYNSKDTIGKVGTLFSLMLSGAGSGLTHQPDAVLGMMDNEIQRDLEAQKTSQTNKQNWYKMAMENQLNQANVANKNAATVGEYMTNENKDLLNAALQKNLKQFDVTVPARAKNMSTIGMAGMLQDKINSLPPGITKIQYQSQFDNMIKPAIAQSIVNNNKTTEAKVKTLQATIPTPEAPVKFIPDEQPMTNQPVMDEALFNKKVNNGIMAQNVGMKQPTSIAVDPADKQKILDEQAALQKNRNNMARFLDAFHNIQDLKNAGQAPFSETAKATVAGLGGALGAALGSTGGPLGTSFGAEAGVTGGNALSKAIDELKEPFTIDRQRQISDALNSLGNDATEAEKTRMEKLFPIWTDNGASDKKAWDKIVNHFLAQEKVLSPTMSHYGLYQTPQVWSYRDSPAKAQMLKEQNEMLQKATQKPGQIYQPVNEPEPSTERDATLMTSAGATP